MGSSRIILLVGLLASAGAYRLPVRASIRKHQEGEPDRRTLLGNLAGAFMTGAGWAALPGASSASVGLMRDYIDSDFRFSLKYPVEWFLSKRDPSSPAFAERPSATILVIADYSSGATASVVKTSLSPLIREGMGMPPSMSTSIHINKFEDLLDGTGVATLLVRDRDGQLKSSYDGLMDPEGQKRDSRYLSTVLDVAVNGPQMQFEVATPVQRVKNYKGTTKTVRAPTDVLMMAAPWVADAAPKQSPRLVRTDRNERHSKAKSFLLNDSTVLTLWVSADKRIWDEETMPLQGMLDSFDVMRRVGFWR